MTYTKEEVEKYIINSSMELYELNKRLNDLENSSENDLYAQEIRASILFKEVFKHAFLERWKLINLGMMQE